MLKGNGTSAISAVTGGTNRVTFWSDANTISSDANFTWDASLLTVVKTSIGATQDDGYGVAVRNTTAAAAGAQQYSPPMRWEGQGWKTDATAASQSVEFRAYIVPVQGTANPTGYLLLESSVNAASYAGPFTFSTVGGLSVGSATEMAAGVINANVGFRVANAATSNAVLRGNGTNFVSSAAAALTKSDDTNVTLTLGGTPTTALLDAVSLTLGWTGQLAVSRGGTGASTLTGMLKGNGTSAISAVTGATNRVTFWSDANTISSDANLTWDGSTFTIQHAGSTNGLLVKRTSGYGTLILTGSTTHGGSIIFKDSGGTITAEIDGFASSAGEDGFILSFYTNGSRRWGISTAGILQSNGAQTIQTSTGNLTLATAAGNGNVAVNAHGTGDFVVFTNMLYVDQSAGFVGIGTTGPTAKLHILDGGTATGAVASVVSFFQSSTIASTNSRIAIVSGTTGVAGLAFGDTASATQGRLDYDNNTDRLDIIVANARQAGLSAAGVFDLNNSSYTASQLVQTDASKNLITSNDLPSAVTLGAKTIAIIAEGSVSGGASPVAYTHNLGRQAKMVQVRDSSNNLILVDWRPKSGSETTIVELLFSADTSGQTYTVDVAA